ncbi:glycosyltransferase family 39 protein [candidate division KSB1 bacterium]|nr:glycosyltransferase family 39 protein [candidate division KSB1 bacterium]NIR68375.1 glycosyltransferase family 39 protein [candidate division KSB1 bacterium]NIS25319.1 glycosyltransferase family 39 protein [candidate division KSB1 bacterium]NIT72230.1 glycosyltransferase family 39 protein [candidate division KSB1 bacterium]NIU26038.1 glycosyltransferase family 39 protein [candidate division KSB1 bacterium]
MSGLNLKRLKHYEKLALIFSGFMFLGLLVLSHFHKMGSYGFETDFYWAYAPDAKNILNGKMPEEPGVGPGYALVLAGLNLIFNDWFFTGKMISVLSAVLCGYFIFKMLQELFNSKVAFFTMILWHVTVMPFAVVASTDMFFAFLVTCGIYFFYRKGVFSNSNLVLSGLLMAYAYLTRHNAVVLPICVAMVILIINPESWTWKKRFTNLALFGAVFGGVLLPWTILLELNSGDAVRSDSYLIIASHFYGRPGVIGSEDMRLAAKKFDSLKSVIFYDFKHFVKHYVFNIYRHFYDLLIHSIKFPSFLFVGAGGLMLFRNLSKRQFSLFLFPALSFLLLCLVHYEPRYYLYIIGFFMFLGAFFLFHDEAVQKKNPGYFGLIHGRELAYAVTIFFLLVFSLKEIKKTISAEPRELLEISSVLRENVQEDESMIARKPHLGFLANLRTKYFPESTTVSELLEYAKKERANYLLYGEVEAEHRPQLKMLLKPENAPEALKPLLVWEKPRTVVYKLRI